MKKIKLSFLKRIFVLFCSTVILSSSVFLSYQNTLYVKAIDDDFDVFTTLCGIGLIIAGVIETVGSGGVLGPVAIGEIALGLTTSGKSLYDYYSVNDDGTYTINEEFIQAVIDAAQQLEDQGFTEDDIIKQKNTNYNLRYETIDNDSLCSQHYVKETIIYECLEYVYGLSACTVTPYVNEGYYLLSVHYADGATHLSEYCRAKNSCGYISTSRYLTFIGQSYGANVPIFSDYETMQHYLQTGQGYKDALNYRLTPLFRRHSSYTPTYTGGSVTVNRTVINNINQKITELDSDESLTDDQKIEILQQYIYSGGASGTGGSGSGNGTGGYPGNTDYEDNKDLPSGTDLTDTNSWLKKIYLKVCQIYDKLNSTVEAVEYDALAKIQDSLDEIIEQLKKIKRWTAVDTVIDGVDAVADWAQFIRDFIDDTTSGVATVASTMTDATELMKTKFPFCLPWDMYILITFLAHEPQAPVFELPIIIEGFGIEEYIVVDLTQFSGLSILSRTLLSIIYCYGLINFTFKVLPIVKEEN